MNTILKMNKISKHYKSVRANHNIDFDLKSGEVHSLLGENGAGKSTLMNILSGVTHPTSGTMELDGKEVSFHSAKDAIARGIGMVYQHFMLIPSFTVAENIMLGVKREKEPFLQIDKAAKAIMDFASQYHMEIDPYALVEDLTIGEQQRVEIVKALFRGARVLVLDEPTAVLTPQEIEELFRMIRMLQKKGHSIIFISHKMNEVLEISNRISILRQGELVETIANSSDLSKEKLAGLMVGREISFHTEKNPPKIGKEILKLRKVTIYKSRHQSVKALNNVSFSVSAGEILGIAGVDGNGQSELLEAITGLRSPKEGKIFLKGKEINGRSPRDILEMGLAHIPEDRHLRGLILDLDIKENFMINDYYRNPHTSGSMLNWDFINGHTKEYIDLFDVRTPSVNLPAGSLSGGNQQKLVLARELHGNPDMIAAMHATRGLDVGAIEYVHKLIMEHRDRGTAVLYISTELEELMNISDRLLVLCKGEITGIVDPQKTTAEQIGLLMSGQKSDLTA